MKEEDFTTLMTIALTVTVIVDDSHFQGLVVQQPTIYSQPTLSLLYSRYIEVTCMSQLLG